MSLYNAAFVSVFLSVTVSGDKSGAVDICINVLRAGTP